MIHIEKSILKTLIYADIFEYPLREYELWKYYSGKRVAYEAFRLVLERLVTEKRIRSKENFYTLPRRQKMVTQRLKRQRIAREKFVISQKIAHLLSYVPTVWFVGLSGALAMQNAPLDDDIDLFIITAPNTLWLTRLCTTILLDVLKLRRKPGETRFKNKICLNMFMDFRSLRLPKKEHDLYSAHEIAQLKLLINKNHAYERFLIANAWIKELLPHAVKTTMKPVSLKIKNGGEQIFFERMSEKLQLWYMRKRKTTEVVERGVLRFHPQDARGWVMEKFNQKVRQLCD